MGRNIEQVNETIKSKIALIISKEMPIDNGLITVSYVDCSPDFKNARVGVSVLPEKLYGTVLSKLKKHNHVFTQILKRETKFREIPRIRWEIDSTEKEAAKLDKIFDEIEKERQ